MYIRTYRPEDEKQVIALWQQCNLITPSNNPQRDIERKINDSPELFFVGQKDNKIIASCMAGYDGHRGWIYYLAVQQNLQRTGIASKIIEYAEQNLMRMGCPKINLMIRESNTEVISFYRKTGYENDPVLVLSKRLSEDNLYTK